MLTRQELSAAKQDLRIRMQAFALSAEGMLVKEWIDLRKQELFFQLDVTPREELPVLQGQIREANAFLEALTRK